MSTTNAAANAADTTTAKKEPKSQVEKKEVEEEEFEEFPVQEWPGRSQIEEDEVNVWEDNWDDETHESEFSKQLREELRKSGHHVA